MEFSDQPGAKCRRCKKLSKTPYCKSCRIKIIKKKIDGRLPDVPLPMESVIGDFISQMASGKKPVAHMGKSRYEAMTARQLEEFLGKKIALTDAAEMAYALEGVNPGSANSFYNAIKKYKNHTGK